MDLIKTGWLLQESVSRLLGQSLTINWSTVLTSIVTVLVWVGNKGGGGHLFITTTTVINVWTTKICQWEKSHGKSESQIFVYKKSYLKKKNQHKNDIRCSLCHLFLLWRVLFVHFIVVAVSHVVVSDETFPWIRWNR